MWKPIPGLDGYEASDEGEIRNKNLKIIGGKNGFPYIGIKLKDKKTYRVHVLIAKTFIPNPDNKPHVDHINRDKLDNRACNLRWVTVQENIQNIGLFKTNTSGFKGVSFHKHTNRFRARYADKHLGLFETAAEAGEAYDNYAKSISSPRNFSHTESRLSS